MGIPDTARLAITVWSLPPPYDKTSLGKGWKPLKIRNELKKQYKIWVSLHTFHKAQSESGQTGGKNSSKHSRSKKNPGEKEKWN